MTELIRNSSSMRDAVAKQVKPIPNNPPVKAVVGRAGFLQFENIDTHDVDSMVEELILQEVRASPGWKRYYAIEDAQPGSVDPEINWYNC